MIYCRVSCAYQRQDLECQARRVAEGCGRRSISLEATVTRGWVTIVVLNSEEVQGELMRDMTEALTLRCARLCGRRSACKHADAAIWAVEGAL